MERSDPKIGWSAAERSGAVSGRERKPIEWSGVRTAEHGAGGRGARTEHGAGGIGRSQPAPM